MGMKSKSGHFGSGAGGPSKREGGLRFKVNLQYFAKMPKQRAQVMHIMANRKGHLIDTPANRKILETISDDKKNFIKSDPRGFNVYSKVVNGKEYWVYERNGIIQDGGVNEGNFKHHQKGGKRKWLTNQSKF